MRLIAVTIIDHDDGTYSVHGLEHDPDGGLVGDLCADYVGVRDCLVLINDALMREASVLPYDVDSGVG